MGGAGFNDSSESLSRPYASESEHATSLFYYFFPVSTLTLTSRHSGWPDERQDRARGEKKNLHDVSQQSFTQSHISYALFPCHVKLRFPHQSGVMTSQFYTT